MAINYHNHNINTSGTITSSSGNFTTLIVNGTSVSNFNSSVSGLLPTIANSGDNRILTSTGSSVGINAEANLTFDGSTLGIIGNVGIGTASGRVVSGYKFLTINDTIGSYVDLLSNGTRIGELGAEPGSMTLAAVGASMPLILRTNDEPRMTISANGNVGIGTSSPSALLEVAGSSKFTGAATFTISSGSSVPISIVNSGSGNSLVVATNFIVDGSGRLGLFGAPRSFEACAVLGTAPSSSQASLGFRVQCTYPSSTTTDAASFSSFPTTQAASYTLTNLYHFGAFQQGFGAGSTVTNQYGLFVDSTLTGATNNYAVYTGIGSGSGRWAIYAAGTAASYFGGQVQISAGSGSSGSYKPGIAVIGDDDTGIAQVGASPANTLSIVTNGSERVRVTSGGNVGVGIDAPTINANGTVVHVHNGTASRAAMMHFTNAESGSAATNGLIVGKWSDNDNYFWEYGARPTIFGTSGTERMRIASDGVITMPDVYGDTVGATNRDLFIDDTGKLGYVSSIRASKTNITTIDNVSWLRDLTPVSFFYRRRNEDGTYSDEPDGTLDYGLIAEDVEAVAPELCFYDIVDDNPELRGIHYSKLITPMLKYIQQLEDRIASLETRLGDNV